MKIFKFYAIDFSCYKTINIVPEVSMDHCSVFPLDCDILQEAKKKLKNNQVLLKVKGEFKNSEFFNTNQLFCEPFKKRRTKS